MFRAGMLRVGNLSLWRGICFVCDGSGVGEEFFSIILVK
jgi:hypothetical protein